MLHGITWGQFLIAAMGVGCLYYLVMIGFFLKDKVKKGQNPDPAGNDQQKRRFWQVSKETSVSDTHETEAWAEEAPHSEEETTRVNDGERRKEEEEEDKAFDQLSELARLIEGILTSENEALGRKELTQKVAHAMRRFPQLNRPPYKIAVANLVRRKAQADCNLTLTADEVDALW